MKQLSFELQFGNYMYQFTFFGHNQILKHFILFAASKSQIFRAPDMEPATTISSAFPNLTASTGLVCPAKLYKVGKAYRENLK